MIQTLCTNLRDMSRVTILDCFGNLSCCKSDMMLIDVAYDVHNHFVEVGCVDKNSEAPTASCQLQGSASIGPQPKPTCLADAQNRMVEYHRLSISSCGRTLSMGFLNHGFCTLHHPSHDHKNPMISVFSFFEYDWDPG